MYNQIAEEITRLRDRKSNLYKDLSSFDLNISDIEHLIENIKPSASDGYKIMIELQANLKKRRLIKEEMIEIDMMLTHWCNIQSQLKDINDKITQNKNKIKKYKIRTDYGIDIFNKYSKLEIRGKRVVVCSQEK